MNLQTILYGEFTPPKTYTTRRHTILCYNGREPKPYVPPPVKPNLQLERAEILLELIKQYPGMSVVEAAEKLGNGVAYVYTLRDILISQGAIDCVRGRSIRRGGPKTTLFYAKGTYAG